MRIESTMEAAITFTSFEFKSKLHFFQSSLVIKSTMKSIAHVFELRLRNVETSFDR